jgi:hypothetical protein
LVSDARRCSGLAQASRGALTNTRGALSKERLAEQAGYEASGGGFNNALSRLRTLELIEGRGDLRLAEELRT